MSDRDRLSPYEVFFLIILALVVLVVHTIDHEGQVHGDRYLQPTYYAKGVN